MMEPTAFTLDPRIGLLVALAALAAAVTVFWPVRGLYWRWSRGRRAGERILIEDALKHLYDCEYRSQPCTLHTLAGALGLSGDQAAELLRRLQALELVRQVEDGHRLTPAGRSEALRVLRVHRLVERYLSDETGLDAREWHAEAEYREHRLSTEEVEAMSARMGHPRFDPHGDPIPTANGEVPPQRGFALSRLAVGRPAEVVHVEDEPAAVYAQLVAAGIYPGLTLRVLEATPTRIRFEAAGDEQTLAPVVAANVTVEPLAEPAASEAMTPLSALRSGETAEVLELAPACRGVERRRLLDLGLVPGTVVHVELSAAGGDPTAYRIRGTLIALRREQAELIHVRPLDERGAA